MDTKDKKEDILKFLRYIKDRIDLKFYKPAKQAGNGSVQWMSRGLLDELDTKIREIERDYK